MSAEGAPKRLEVDRDYCRRVTTDYLDALDAKREREAAGPPISQAFGPTPAYEDYRPHGYWSTGSTGPVP